MHKKIKKTTRKVTAPAADLESLTSTPNQEEVQMNANTEVSAPVVDPTPEQEAVQANSKTEETAPIVAPSLEQEVQVNSNTEETDSIVAPSIEQEAVQANDNTEVSSPVIDHAPVEEVQTIAKSQSEIFTLQNLTHALGLVYGNHPRFNEDFLKGMVIRYNTNNTRRNIWEICESPFLKETVEAIANTGALPEILMESKHYGYMMVHFLLAISDDADMVPLLKVLPPLLNGERDEDMDAILADPASELIWRSTNTGINLLHAAAMNNHHRAAVNVATILLAHCTEEQLFQTDALGLLPVHYAVINGNVELVRILREKMATFEALASDDTEPMTIFPVSSFVLENLLANNKMLDDVHGLRCMENRPAKWTERPVLTDDEISEADSYLRGGELVAASKLRALLSAQDFLRCTPFGKALLNEMSLEKDLVPLRASVMDGLLEPLTPVLHTWNKFHAAAISPTTTEKKLTDMVNADATGLFEADAHGRPPLFYAVAYAKTPVVKWFLEQYETHHQKVVGEDVLGIDLNIAAYCSNSRGNVTDRVRLLLDKKFKDSEWEVQPGNRQHGCFLELDADDFAVLNPGCHHGLKVTKEAKADYDDYPAYGHKIVWPFLLAIAKAAGNNAVRRYITKNPFEWNSTEKPRKFSVALRDDLGAMPRNLLLWELKGCN